MGACLTAHCGTRSVPSDDDYLPQFARMALEHEKFYGDTSALNLPPRSYAWHTLLASPALLSKIVHGSDWPILSLPPLRELGLRGVALMAEPNWMQRDILIKQRLGLDDGYWHRASKILRLHW